MILERNPSELRTTPMDFLLLIYFAQNFCLPSRALYDRIDIPTSIRLHHLYARRYI